MAVHHWAAMLFSVHPPDLVHVSLELANHSIGIRKFRLFQQQTVASPIFFWKDIDIWLYLLAEEVDFNDAYRLGYDRVGCWCCPNNNQRAQFLSRIYMPEESKKWREFLIGFAKKNRKTRS